jgi:MoxR-like ATPase
MTTNHTNHTNSVNHTQAASIIAAIGQHTTVLLQGSPGQGKSALLHTLHKKLPKHTPQFIDCGNLDLGDIGSPVIDRERKVTNYYPNDRFGVCAGCTAPVAIMLDDLDKATKPVLNMLMPVMYERRIGDVPLPAGSVVFATMNPASDAVGGTAIPAILYNRAVTLDYRNVTNKEWLTWAVNNSTHPAIMAFAENTPQAFVRYDSLDVKANNPYVFDPRKGQTKQFVTPRSLAAASRAITSMQADGADHDTIVAVVAGALGATAAADVRILLTEQNDMPRYSEIVANPSKVRLPKNVGQYYLAAFSLATATQPKDVTAVITYINRWKQEEAVALWCSMSLSHLEKATMLCANASFAALAAKFGKYF